MTSTKPLVDTSIYCNNVDNLFELQILSDWTKIIKILSKGQRA